MAHIIRMLASVLFALAALLMLAAALMQGMMLHALWFVVYAIAAMVCMAMAGLCARANALHDRETRHEQ